MSTSRSKRLRRRQQIETERNRRRQPRGGHSWSNYWNQLAAKHEQEGRR